MDPYGGLLRGALAPTGPHLLVSAPTGAGKTRRVLAPGIVTWDGPVVAVSSKRDLMDLTLARRLTQGVCYLLDLSGQVTPPAGVRMMRPDPAASIDTPDGAIEAAELLLHFAAVGQGGSGNGGGAEGFWNQTAAGPLAALLLAAGPDGMPWALAAVERDVPGEEELPDLPSWSAAVDRLARRPDAAQLAAKLVALSEWDERLRTSVVATMAAAVAGWLRPSIAGQPDHKIWTPARLQPRPGAGTPTLYVVAPGSGASAGVAVTVIDAIISAWRRATDAALRPPPPVLLSIDEIANTSPLPKLVTYVTEGRGLGIRIVAAAQSTDALKERWGEHGAAALRVSFPAVLLMYGAQERQLVETAAWAGGEVETFTASFAEDHGHGSDRRSRSARLVQAIKPHELFAPDPEHGRLLIHGRAGHVVALPDISVYRPPSRGGLTRRGSSPA